jgi:hypothetical protein
VKTVNIHTGPDHIVANSVPITNAIFGYNYTGFRNFARFESQLSDSRVGLISWPGGSLAENLPERFGLQYDDLWNAKTDFGLPTLFAEANELGAGVSIVLPTKRYADDRDLMHREVDAFMDRVLDGRMGKVPDRLIFEIGNEYYSTFGTGAANATRYGDLADDMVRTISAALADPLRNPQGLDAEIAVQSGRSLVEDAAIRSEMSEQSLRDIDMLIYHRFAPYATGIDTSIGTLEDTTNAWERDMEAAGGARPTIFMSSYNVASYTRAEALQDFIEAQADLGNTIDPSSIDLDGRTDTAFETFWQTALTKRHYGIEQTRVLLELQAHVGSVGLGAASVYGVDMQHPARLSWTGVDGVGDDFVGQDILDMMAESTQGTRLLDVSLQNNQRSNLWTYGFEDKDKVIAFVAWHNTPPGELRVQISGLADGAYKAVWGESLHAEVRPDWMEHYGIPDNPNVDETPESLSFAVGVREHVTLSATEAGVIVPIARPHEIIRLAFAKTDAGMAQIDEWDDNDPLMLTFDGGGDGGGNDDGGGDGGGEPPPDDGGADAMDGAGLAGLLGAMLLLVLLGAAV